MIKYDRKCFVRTARTRSIRQNPDQGSAPTPRHPDSVIQLVKVESEHVEKHSASSNGEDRNSLH
ncbi:hypothetical protein ALP86_200148 [Pseudomonas amygdali pv. mori]|nr:hypothetical protein ALP86_200148 [Pseudomonas amygdali pv. mori]